MTKKLHRKFAVDKSLSAGAGPLLVITRTTVATYFDANGIMQTADSGAARFEYDPVTSESLGLLTEPARTNICKQSEDFNTTWGEFQAASEFNQTTAPDGKVTADRLLDDSGGGNGATQLNQAITVLSATEYTLSCFFKADQLGWAKLTIDGLGAIAPFGFFDVTNGVIGTLDPVVTAATVQAIRDGWFRCSITFTSDVSDLVGTIRIYPAEADGDNTIPRDGGSSIFLWGCVLEVGGYPTSYIKTITSSVARNSDDIKTTDMSWFSDGSPGTFFVAGRPATADTDDAWLWAISSGGPTDRISAWRSGAAGLASVVTDASVTQALPISSSGQWVKSRQSKSIFTWDTDDFRLYNNASVVGTPDTSGSIPSGMTTLNIGSNSNTIAWWHGHISEIWYEDGVKTNAELIIDTAINYTSLTVGDSLSGASGWTSMIKAWNKTEAVGGYKLIDDIEPAFQTDMDGRAPTTTHVIIQGGVNDVIGGATAANMKAATTSMINTAKVAGLSILVMGLSPWKNQASWDAGKQTITDDYNTWLAAQATVQGFTYVDIYTALEDATADELEAAYDSGDGLHPNAAGYTVIAALVDHVMPAATVSTPFYLAITRRTAKQMRPKQRMAKPTRGLFR